MGGTVKRERATIEKVWRGEYLIKVDGVLFGTVIYRSGRWVAEPILPQPSEHACVADQPHGHQGSRLDIAQWLLDYSGIPLSIARNLLLGWDLNDAVTDEVWIIDAVDAVRDTNKKP